MKEEIKSAIETSIENNEQVHIAVEAADIYDALSGVDYDDATQENDGSWDVWGDIDGDSWRIKVTVR